ncbi:hypothetical protein YASMINEVIRUS_437 [Yasminevirus sp. GU-2018]|uniref:Uncharacterized protein n=1 Tax=Yasminevirus sp. GU-2018 TaxID=2420051 RepID=A0A5K0U906_9VIRU|nr:hypothetical protein YASMINEVIRUS_437 [Yasminevirus sp. GU-2018]
MPRGRPPKNKPPVEEVDDDAVNEKNFKKISTKGGAPPLVDSKNEEEPVRQKRKYTRRKPVEQNKADDGTVIKPEAKKRGRKRGRKKKDQDMLFKPEEVIDYVHRNFPLMGIDRIREKVMEGLKKMREFGDNPYLLYKFTYNANTYYYDDKGAILNEDGQMVGVFIKQDDGFNKMYMFARKKDNTLTHSEVLEALKKK